MTGYLGDSKAGLVRPRVEFLLYWDRKNIVDSSEVTIRCLMHLQRLIQDSLQMKFRGETRGDQAVS